jgi:hypothetical protein
MNYINEHLMINLSIYDIYCRKMPQTFIWQQENNPEVFPDCSPGYKEVQSMSKESGICRTHNMDFTGGKEVGTDRTVNYFIMEKQHQIF